MRDKSLKCAANPFQTPKLPLICATLHGMTAEQTLQPQQSSPSRSIWSRFRINLDEILPHTHLESESMAIFTYEARRLRYGRTLADLKQMTLRWLGLSVLVTVGLWVLVLLITGDYQRSQETLGSMLSLMLMLSLMDKFVYDFIGLTTGLDSIRADYNSQRWPLIAVSDMSMNRLVAIKYLVIQISAWRTMLLVVCLRLSVIVLMIFNFFVMPLLYGQADYRSLSPLELAFTVFFFIIYVIIAVTYVIEPRWRLRALSAASLLNSLRGRDASVGLLWSLPSFFRLWGVQIVIGVVAFIGLSLPSGLINLILWDNPVVVGLLYVLYVLGIGAFIRYSYRAFASVRLRKVYKRLIEDGGGL